MSGKADYATGLSWESEFQDRDYDSRELAGQLVDIDERLENSETSPEDILFLTEVSATAERHEGLQQYADDLLSQYNQRFIEEELSDFEEYRDPWSYFKSLAKDWKTLSNNSRYGETGIEFFTDYPSRVDDWKEKAEMKTFEAMSTNIGREVALNFMQYKPRGPFWDIAGATYGFFKGLRMEVEERDMKERFKEVLESED